MQLNRLTDAEAATLAAALRWWMDLLYSCTRAEAFRLVATDRPCTPGQSLLDLATSGCQHAPLTLTEVDAIYRRVESMRRR